MKRNSRNRVKLQIKPLKIDLTEAEILADLQYGVDGKSRRERTTRRGTTIR